ncbi:hypothetical protein P3T22_006308 [Paraburkholderia sp. GAS348]|uniref:ChrB C-terminal domain-containing protein n=1 Tax=Paraburkholderia phytofirmans OLGA172 TaxID=1417228 RepID=A0A160FUV8_9BURK|nr:hypothetical protein AYM40_32535 [Paraburkholderia phytofirmans OLGA172]
MAGNNARGLWVDRVASAWLIRRFIDPKARFLWLDSPEACPPEASGLYTISVELSRHFDDDHEH